MHLQYCNTVVGSKVVQMAPPYHSIPFLTAAGWQSIRSGRSASGPLAANHSAAHRRPRALETASAVLGEELMMLVLVDHHMELA